MHRKFIIFATLTTMLVVAAAFGSRPNLEIGNKRINKAIEEFCQSADFELEQLSGTDQLKAVYCNINKQGRTIGYAYLGRVNSCRAGGCNAAPAETDDQTSEYFDYLVLLDTTLAVRNVKIINYQATHGQEIANKGWLKQFIGIDGQNYKEVGKDIDAIAGATISVYAITHDVNEVPTRFQQILVNNSMTNDQHRSATAAVQ